MMSSNVSSGSGGEISLRSSQENQSSSDTIEKLSEDQIGSVFNTHIDYQYVSTSSRLIQRTEQMESLADCSTTCLNDTKCEVATWVGEKQEVSATGKEDESCTESNPYVRPSTILVPVLSNLCVMHSHFESENLHAAVGYTTIVRKVLGRDSHAAALPSSIDETSQNFNMQRFLDVENLANTSFPSYNHLYFIIGAFIALAVIFVVLIISKFGVRFVWRCLCCGNRCCFVDPGESSDTVGASQAQGTFYTPERLLGEGTYGCVFLVCRSSDKKYCALKYIPCRYPNDIVQAYCELKSLQQVQGHENVIQVLDAFASWPEENQELLSIPNSFFRSAMDIQQIEPLMRNCRIRWNPWSYFCIITDYYPERTMFHLLVRRKNAPLSEQRILEYTTQVCHAVQHLHNCNMIHRDLKPGNLLLTNEGSKIVLTDFGLTRALEAGAYAHTRAGTLHYFAPEQAKHRYTNKADIWAIGCLIYSMATRRVTKATARTMFIDRLQPDFEEVIGAELAREGYSVYLVRLVLKLLEQDPHLRPTAAGALKLIQEAKMRDLLPAPRDSEASKLSDRSSDCTAVSVGDNVKGRESEIKEVDIEATESNACHVEINPSRKRNTTRNEGEEPLLDHCD